MKNKIEDGGKKMKKFVSEFRDFIMRGNVLDMAVGVIVGAAFNKITTSLVNDVLMPFIGLIAGGQNFTDRLNVVLVKPTYNEAGEVVDAGVTIGFGSFLATIIDFIIIAFVVFLLIKLFNRARTIALKRKLEAEKAEAEAKAAEEASKPKAPTQEELLVEIRDLLKAAYGSNEASDNNTTT